MNRLMLSWLRTGESSRLDGWLGGRKGDEIWGGGGGILTVRDEVVEWDRWLRVLEDSIGVAANVGVVGVDDCGEFELEWEADMRSVMCPAAGDGQLSSRA